MKIVAIVQARMGSERLPGKVLMKVAGRTLLEHGISRLRKATRLGEIVVAIPNTTRDDELFAFCADHAYEVFRGSEENVLSRYYEAAKTFQADAVVRITADCPLIDPETVDAIVRRHEDSGDNDYTCNVLLRTFPRGVDTEVVSMGCLERLHREATLPIHREHVTNLIHQRPSEFKIENILRAKGDSSHLRICVDTQEDFDVVKAVVSSLGVDCDLDDVIQFLGQHPEIANLNAAVRQKPQL